MLERGSVECVRGRGRGEVRRGLKCERGKGSGKRENMVVFVECKGGKGTNREGSGRFKGKGKRQEVRECCVCRKGIRKKEKMGRERKRDVKGSEDCITGKGERDIRGTEECVK